MIYMKMTQSMHSVRDSIAQDSAIANLVQMFRTPKYVQKIVVVVEGSDDKKLFSRFFKEERSYIHPIGGNIKFTSILDELNNTYESRFIVLKDADFDHLNRIHYPYPNMFLTDMHDTETMMINEDTIKNICCEFLCPTPPSEFIEKLYGDLKALSYLKWYNSVKGIRLNFKILKLTDIYNGDIPTELHDILSKLYANEANFSKEKITIEQIGVFISSQKEVYPLLLVNGHDLCEAVVVALKKLGVKENIKKDNVSRCLRSSYTHGHFKSTRMFGLIDQWSMANSCDILCS